MLYCCVWIDYLSQLERAGVAEAGAFIEELRSIAAAFGATCGQKKNPLVLAFPSEGMFDRLQAAEALQRCVESLEAYEPRLRGASVVAHEAASAEDAIAYAASQRYGEEAAYSFKRSPEADLALNGYFSASESSWARPLHRSALADADAARLFYRPRLAETLERTLAKTSRGGPRLVHLEAGPGVRALDSRTGIPADRTLALYGQRTRPRPFSPLAEAISELGPAASSGSAASPEADGDAKAFAFVLASSFSIAAPESVARGCAAYIDRRLDELGRSGVLIVCDEPGLFSPEAVALITRRLADGRGSEHYVSIASGSLPEAWAGPWAAKVPAGFADADDRGGLLEAALGSSVGSAREALRERFLAIQELGTGDKLSGLLEALPREASIYLFILSVVDNDLSEAELSAFVGRLGLWPEGEALVRGLLARAGLVDPSDLRTPIPPIREAELAERLGAEVEENLRERLSAFLVGLYRKGRIRPSLGFLSRVGEAVSEEKLLYDCVLDEALRPDKAGTVDPGFLSPSSLCAYRFWSALTAGDRATCEAQAAAEERISGPRAQALRALVRAELAYACGDAERASKGAREAMLAMGKGAPPKLEARSQRMMGLAALALDRHTEASDYLTNAQELSEQAGDEYERMMAAYSKAVVEFLSGALVKSEKAAACAEESASRLTRVDALAAVTALRGRIRLELGAYDEAARHFSSLIDLAALYPIPGAARRAAIWRARARAYAGEYEEAAADLESEADDPEARVFRGELEILRGRPRDARPWLESPAEPSLRPFGPPDAFDWGGLFSEIEGRSIGFDAADAPLATLRTALSLFARGLDERDPECASELHALTRSEKASKNDPGMGTYSFFCYLLEERLPEPPVDKQTVLSRSFKILQQRAGRIEDRAQRALYMEKNSWNKRLMEAARTHKFI